jgi:hypothetical protein
MLTIARASATDTFTHATLVALQAALVLATLLAMV